MIERERVHQLQPRVRKENARKFKESLPQGHWFKDRWRPDIGDIDYSKLNARWTPSGNKGDGYYWTKEDWDKGRGPHFLPGKYTARKSYTPSNYRKKTGTIDIQLLRNSAVPINMMLFPINKTFGGKRKKKIQNNKSRKKHNKSRKSRKKKKSNVRRCKH